MILVIEVAFLIAGLYALFTATMPAWMMGKGYKAEGPKVRVLGAVMAALLPAVFCLGLVLGIVGGTAGFDPTGWITALEVIIVIVMAIIVTVVLRNIRQPDVPSAPSEPPANIEPK